MTMSNSHLALVQAPIAETKHNEPTCHDVM